MRVTELHSEPESTVVGQRTPSRLRLAFLRAELDKLLETSGEFHPEMPLSERGIASDYAADRVCICPIRDRRAVKEAVISHKRGRSLCGAGAGPDRGRMAGRHPPRWTIRNRRRWPPRGPARRDERQWAQRASRGGRRVRGDAGRVLTSVAVDCSSRWFGAATRCPARTPPPRATRCGGEARRTARLTRWAGAVGR